MEISQKMDESNFYLKNKKYKQNIVIENVSYKQHVSKNSNKS